MEDMMDAVERLQKLLTGVPKESKLYYDFSPRSGHDSVDDYDDDYDLDYGDDPQDEDESYYDPAICDQCGNYARLLITVDLHAKTVDYHDEVSCTDQVHLFRSAEDFLDDHHELIDDLLQEDPRDSAEGIEGVKDFIEVVYSLAHREPDWGTLLKSTPEV